MKTRIILYCLLLAISAGLQAQADTVKSSLQYSEFERQLTVSLLNTHSREDVLQQIELLEQTYQSLPDDHAALLWLQRCRAGLIDARELLEITQGPFDFAH